MNRKRLLWTTVAVVAASFAEAAWYEVPTTEDDSKVIQLQCLTWPSCQATAGRLHRSDYLLNKTTFDLEYMGTSDDYTVDAGDVRYVWSLDRIAVNVIDDEDAVVGRIDPLPTMLEVFLGGRGYSGAHQYTESRCDPNLDCARADFWDIKNAVLELGDHPANAANLCAYRTYVDDGHEQQNDEVGLDAPRFVDVLKSFHRDTVGIRDGTIAVLSSPTEIRGVATDVFTTCCAFDPDRASHRLCGWTPPE